MEFRQDYKTSAGILREAVPLMVEREIPPTPNNYALWYAHAADEDINLSEALLASFPEAGTYNEDRSEQLFFEYFVKQYLPQSEDTQNAVASLLAKLFGVVNITASGTHEYGDALKAAMATMESSTDEAEIQETLALLLDKTHAVEDLNSVFQAELKQAKQEVEALKAALQSSQEEALIDKLTKIANRRAFDLNLEQSLADATNPTILMLLDLDHFKLCNDTYGHVMGDKVLECVGQLLLKIQGEAVKPARYGGEEFAIVFEGALGEAEVLAELIRAKVESIRITNVGSTETLKTLSISIGVALAEPGEDSRSLKVRADQGLYKAKENGRNRVCLATPLDQSCIA